MFSVRLKEHLSSGVLEDREDPDQEHQDETMNTWSLIAHLKSIDALIEDL